MKQHMRYGPAKVPASVRELRRPVLVSNES
jgi:hypothetical protein